MTAPDRIILPLKSARHWAVCEALSSFNGWPTYLRADISAAAVAQARQDALEEAARWHDREQAECRLSAENATGFIRDLWTVQGERHGSYSAAIRAIKNKEPT